MKIYWRVKRFRLTGSGVGTFPPPNEDTTGTFNFDPVEIPQTYANSEENLVCSSYFNYFNVVDGNEDVGIDPTLARRNNDGLFALGFSASFSFDGLVDSSGNEYGIDAFYGPDATTTPSTSIKVFDLIMPVYITVDGFGDDAYMGGNLQLTLTPIEYWSYGGTYSTSTGQRL